MVHDLHLSPPPPPFLITAAGVEIVVRDFNYRERFAQVSKAKTLASSKNTSFESSSHYEDINVTSREYAVNGAAGDGGGGSDFCCSSSDGGGSGVARKVKYPKVLPDFPADQSGDASCKTSSDRRRLSLPPPSLSSSLACVPESATKIPPPPPPRISSTLGRKKDPAKTIVAAAAAAAAVPFVNIRQPAVEAIPEEHKSPVVPCVPNRVCPAVQQTIVVPSSSVKKPVEPRIVIKANSVGGQHHQQQAQQQQNHNQQQQKQAKRTNIPRVVHPQNNTDKGNRTAVQVSAVDGAGGAGDTGTVKRKKK